MAGNWESNLLQSYSTTNKSLLSVSLVGKQFTHYFIAAGGNSLLLNLDKAPFFRVIMIGREE
jgi:hypothetical protein